MDGTLRRAGTRADIHGMRVAGDEQLPAAGWYPDQGQVGLLRHWTGTAWTDQWCPLPDPAPRDVPGHADSAARDPFYEAAPVPQSDGPIMRAGAKVIAVVISLMGLGRLVTGLMLLRTPDGGVSGWALTYSLVGLVLATVGILALVRPSWVSIRWLRPGERLDRTPAWTERLGPFQALVLRAVMLTCFLGVTLVIVLSHVRG